MIGKNGINEKSEKSIIIFDSSIQLEKIRSMQETENSQIISMDYQSFRLLKDNNIPCISSDESQSSLIISFLTLSKIFWTNGGAESICFII